MNATNRICRTHLCVIFLMFLLSCECARAQSGSASRLLVAFRTMPTSPAGAEDDLPDLLGTRRIHRQSRLHTASIEGDARIRAALLADPRVEFVVEDRMMAATAMYVAAEGSEEVHRLRPNTPHLDLPADNAADSFYTNSPQGWAVRAVGGFGGGVAGSSAGGPWSVTTGTGVRIAVLDSGVDRNHPDISPNLVFEKSEIDGIAQPSPCDDGSPQDQTGHGTWVASLAAGAAGRGTGRVVGVAPGASLLNIKVLQRMPGDGATPAQRCAAGQAGGLLSWVLQGIDDAIAQHADVIVLSMSLTLDLYSGDSAGVKAMFDRATHAAAEAGAVVVAAAGNDAFDFTNPRYVTVPAQSRDVLATVASTNPECAENLASGSACSPGTPSVAYYSNRGAPLNALAAPGGSYPAGGDEAVSGWVRGACSGGLTGSADGLPADGRSQGCFNLGHAAYVQAIGTSASAPLAAGAAALIRAAHPDWTPATVVRALRATADRSSAVPGGLINAAAALVFQP